MEDNKEGNNYGFPSHLIPLKKKDRQWHLQYVKAFDKEYKLAGSTILRNVRQDYLKWRQLANGKQPINGYKEILSTTVKDGKQVSWKVLDWNILPIYPRFVNVMKNRLLKQYREIQLSAIDQTSVNKERERKAKIQEYLWSKEYNDKIKKENPNIRIESPFEEGEIEPENANEIDLYLEMYPKNKYILHMKDQIDLSFLLSDWKMIEDKIMEDLIVIGIGGSKVFLDNIGRIRVRRVIPEQMICNTCVEKDFSDLIRVGEYRQITISELRQNVKENTFTLDDYAKMASIASGRTYSSFGAETYFYQNNRFPWDHEKITILDIEFFSASDVVHVVSNDEKGKKIIKKDKSNFLSKIGITDDEYEKANDREIIRKTVNNVHTASWVVDTDFIYDYGIQSNIIRSANSLFDCKLSTTIHTLNFDSLTRQVEPILDNIQINWLQYQHQLAQSKPDGLAIERRALQSVTVGMQKFTTPEILQMYVEKGSFIFNGTDQHGRPYPFKPFEVIKGGISPAALQHLEFIFTCIDMLRGVLGLSEVTDSSTPDPRTGKAVAQISVQATSNALGTIWDTFLSIYEKTAMKICLLVPESETLTKNGILNSALGDDTQDYLVKNKNLTLLDFAIRINAGIDPESKIRLSQHIESSLKKNNGVLEVEDAFLIEQEQNIHRAYLILAQKRRIREKEIQLKQQEVIKSQTDGNTQTAQIIEQEKQKTLEIELSVFEKKKQIEYEYKMKLQELIGTQQVILKKIETGAKLTINEQQIAHAMESEIQEYTMNMANKMVDADGQQPSVKNPT